MQELLNATADTDGDGTINWDDPNDDNDMLSDTSETACGSDPLLTASLPERVDGPFAAADDDGDTFVDEALPATASNFDCDGDGYKGSAESHVFSYLPQTTGDQKTCQEFDTSFPNSAPHIRPSKRWPSDIAGAGSFSSNKVNVQDLSSFLTPAKYMHRQIGTYPGDVRFDLVPGTTFGQDINIQDLAAMTTGPSAFPPMLGGTRAFGGPECPWAE
jgi:hypothetical protein